MRFYPKKDIWFYVEYPETWGSYCKWPPNKSWKYGNKDFNNVHTIWYWRDLKGAKKKEIKMSDLYFEKWMYDRKRFDACLPIFYSVGNRFIAISKAFPTGFKCSPLPMSLAEVQEIKAQQRALEKQKREEEKKLAAEGKLGKKKKK